MRCCSTVAWCTALSHFEELQRIRAVDAQDSAPRGPIAIVHTDPTLYRKACAYPMLVATERRVEVFEDRDEAERWLREQGF